MNRKTQEKIEAMREGGRKLAHVKKKCVEAISPGTTFEELEAIASQEIAKVGAKTSFTTVGGYKYATCITKNAGCCHGIPVGRKVDEGDVVTIDVGLIWLGYHLDTSITVYAGDEKLMKPEIRHFLEVGREALKNAIAQVRIGNSVYDISKAMQQTHDQAGFGSVYQLTGHTIGHNLHEDPQIPCVAYRSDKKHKLFEGQTVAIETMYTQRSPVLVVGSDGWTYETRDGSLSGMFEETVLISLAGPVILT